MKKYEVLKIPQIDGNLGASGVLVEEKRGGEFVAVMHNNSNLVLAITTTYYIGPNLLVMDSVDREMQASRGIQHLGTVAGCIGAIATIRYFLEETGHNEIMFAFHAPPDYYWSRLRSVLNLDQEAGLDLGGRDNVILLPARFFTDRDEVIWSSLKER